MYYKFYYTSFTHTNVFLSSAKEFMDNFSYINPYIPRANLLRCYKYKIYWLFSILPFSAKEFTF